jgi:hypothetical protein
MSHVAWEKIHAKLCDMFHNLFAWYGYQEYLPVYLMPFTISPIQTLVVQSWLGIAGMRSDDHRAPECGRV